MFFPNLKRQRRKKLIVFLLSFPPKNPTWFQQHQEVWALWSRVQGCWTLSANGLPSVVAVVHVYIDKMSEGEETQTRHTAVFCCWGNARTTTELPSSFCRGMFSIRCRQFWLCSLLQPLPVACITHRFISSCLCSFFPTASNLSFPLTQILHFLGFPSSPFSSVP